MSASRYSRLPTGQLVQQFIAQAAQVGAGWNMAGKPAINSPAAAALRQELYAIGAELQARLPLVEVAELFDHPDRNVRLWAVGQFGRYDKLRTSCAILGFGKRKSSGIGGEGEDLTATEAMRFRDRALCRPPHRPRLSEMATQLLVDRFEDGCLRQFGSKFVSNEKGFQDTDTRNRIVGEISQIVGELHARDAVPSLLPFLDHPNLMVRYVTATYCLPFASQKAVTVLEEMDAAGDPVESFFASTTLAEWRRGIFTKLDYSERGASVP